MRMQPFRVIAGNDTSLPTMGAQFGVQFIGVIATVAITATMTFVIWKLVGLMTRGSARGKRSKNRETILHEERGYDIL